MKLVTKMVCLFVFITVLQNLWASSQAMSKGELERQVLQLENIWAKGDSFQYFQGAVEIYDQIKDLENVSLKNEIAGKILKNVLMKEVKPDSRNSTTDLSVLEKSIDLFLENKDPEFCLTHIQLLCNFRGKIHKEIVPNFSPRYVVGNVSPPPGVPGAAGMSPEAISDPVARSKYEAAIRENRQNAITNSRQSYLKSLSRKYDPLIEDCLIKVFAGKTGSTNKLKECLKCGGFSNEQQSEILKKVK